MEKIISRLDSQHRQLLETITPIDDERFAHRPTKAEWSLAEVVHHLCLVEQHVIKVLETALADPPQRHGLWQRVVPLWIVGSRSIRVKAPKSVEPLNAPPKEDVIDNYRRTRATLREFGITHGRSRLQQLTMKHPFLGNLDGVGAVSFVGYHERRHYKQILEIIKKIN